MATPTACRRFSINGGLKMLERIKLSMRIFHNMLDTDITTNITACMLDLQRVGVSKEHANEASEDALIYKAAELYCKWQYDFNSKAEQFEKAYINLRNAISLCGTYAESGESADV